MTRIKFLHVIIKSISILGLSGFTILYVMFGAYLYIQCIFLFLQMNRTL